MILHARTGLAQNQSVMSVGVSVCPCDCVFTSGPPSVRVSSLAVPLLFPPPSVAVSVLPQRREERREKSEREDREREVVRPDLKAASAMPLNAQIFLHLQP